MTISHLGTGQRLEKPLPFLYHPEKSDISSMNSGLVLFSGGLDSTTALYWARPRYGRLEALSFDYGQRHRREVELAALTASRLGIRPVLIKVDLTQVGGSALTDAGRAVPKSDDWPARGAPSGPPPTYVPFRNGIFIGLAAAWAEVRGIEDLICGFHVLDSPDYPDTRPEFVEAMEAAVRAGTWAGRSGAPLRIVAPFLHFSKSAIIREGLRLGADYSTSVSCYEGGEVPCSRCPACHLRRRAWSEAGREDPLLERLKKEGRL